MNNIGLHAKRLLVYLFWTAAFLVVSRILFDALAGRPPFWSSQEGIELLLFHALVGGPFIMFALLVAAQRNNNGQDGK
jgi:hypothetical protein